MIGRDIFISENSLLIFTVLNCFMRITSLSYIVFHVIVFSCFLFYCVVWSPVVIMLCELLVRRNSFYHLGMSITLNNALVMLIKIALFLVISV